MSSNKNFWPKVLTPGHYLGDAVADGAAAACATASDFNTAIAVVASEAAAEAAAAQVATASQQNVLE